MAAGLALLTTAATCGPSCLYVRGVTRRQRERHGQLPRRPSLRTRAVAAPRCPFCHEEVTAGEAREWCEGCRARSHAACWREQEGCAACGADVSLAATELASAQRARAIVLVLLVVVVLVVTLGVRAAIE